MTGPYRRPDGGLIDRSVTLTVTFDGREYPAHPGDTLASALLAAGVRVVATGPHTGRPRGVFALDDAEPHAFVAVESGAGETMVAATQVEVYPGLRARSLAGKGQLAGAPDTARYDRTYTHCDVLVVGAGPAGLAAALAAGAGGARVVLADSGPRPGGGVLGYRATLDGAPAVDWVAAAGARLAALPEVRVLRRTTVTGFHDHGYLTAVQRRTDHLGSMDGTVARQRLWHIRAGRVVLATGAHERPIAFRDNDRPGVMLAGAAVGYAWRYAALPGRRAVVFGAHDGVPDAAAELAAAGVDIAAVVDVRDGRAVVGTGAGPDGVLAAALVARIDAAGRATGVPERVPCDLLAVSGGWNPAVHLFSQSGGELAWSARHAAFVPGGPADPGGTARRVSCAGAANGTRDLAAALAEGAEAGTRAARDAGYPAAMPDLPAVATDPRARSARPPAAFFYVPSAAAGAGPGGEAGPVPDSDPVSDADAGAGPVGDAGPGRGPDAGGGATGSGDGAVFLDMARDATLRDVRRAVEAGMTSAEHVKRHTGIGTGPDQGRSSGVLTVGVLAGILGRPMTGTAPTTYRPPYAPVSFALLAGRDRGRLADPERRTALHAGHEAAGVPFEDVGQWKRPWYFPLPGEDQERAVLRECHAARTGAATMDASTLGKIELQGADVGTFLDLMYTGRISTLRVGRCRYGVMCRADGMVFDDGTVSRLAEDRWLMTTTTGNAATVLDWLEEWLQTEWPALDVRCTSVTDQWSTVAVVGPRSRDVLAALAPELDVSAEGFAFMSLREARVAGLPARVYRISFSGELAYEINTPAWYGAALWDAVLAAGEPYGITRYGTETMHVLRAEKGFPIVGQETDGTVTPQDLGMQWAVSTKKRDFVGKRSHDRPDVARTGRQQLVGLLPDDPTAVLAEGAQLAGAGARPDHPPVPMEGHVTSSYRSAALGRSFALALVRDGASRHGESLHAVDGGRVVPVTITDPVQYDPEGARRDG